MANEFVIKNGLIVSAGSTIITGSVISTGGFTGSLQGSASYSFTASYALNAGGATINTSSFASTGSNNFNGNQVITGSLVVTQGITGSLFGTASWALNAVTASYSIINYVTSSITSSTYADSASLATTASYAITASYVARVLPRILTTASADTPQVNVDLYDSVSITALATNITAVTMSGTPVNFQKIIFRIKDDGTARNIAWGSSFQAVGVALPTTTVISKILTTGFIYDTVTGKWGCVASAQET